VFSTSSPSDRASLNSSVNKSAKRAVKKKGQLSMVGVKRTRPLSPERLNKKSLLGVSGGSKGADSAPGFKYCDQSFWALPPGETDPNTVSNDHHSYPASAVTDKPMSRFLLDTSEPSKHAQAGRDTSEVANDESDLTFLASSESAQACFEDAKVEMSKILPSMFKKKCRGLAKERVRAFKSKAEEDLVDLSCFPQSKRIADMKRVINSDMGQLGYDGYLGKRYIPAEFESSWFRSTDEHFTTTMSDFGRDLSSQPCFFLMNYPMLRATDQLSKDLLAISSFQDCASHALFIASQKLCGGAASQADLQSIQTLSKAMFRASVAACGVSMALTSNLELAQRQAYLDRWDLDIRCRHWLRNTPVGDRKVFWERAMQAVKSQRACSSDKLHCSGLASYSSQRGSLD
jgi:hypothetical protein